MSKLFVLSSLLTFLFYFNTSAKSAYAYDGSVRNTKIKYLELEPNGNCRVYFDPTVSGLVWEIGDSIPPESAYPSFYYSVGYGDESNISGRVTEESHLKGMALLLEAFKDQKLCNFIIDVYPDYKPYIKQITILR